MSYSAVELIRSCIEEPLSYKCPAPGNAKIYQKTKVLRWDICDRDDYDINLLNKKINSMIVSSYVKDIEDDLCKLLLMLKCTVENDPPIRELQRIIGKLDINNKGAPHEAE